MEFQGMWRLRRTRPRSRRKENTQMQVLRYLSRRDGAAARTILIKFIFQKIKEKQAFISSPNNLLWFHFCVHLEISILTCSLDTSLFGYFELCCTLMLCGHVCGRLGLVRFGTF
mmetsp:Transcript_3353/g.6441  ORF Transcript_3353/g.6441 Transcript_3353/m.6441 type:complete len:114 (-) Transcript_3353:1801-2142(-)